MRSRVHCISSRVLQKKSADIVRWDTEKKYNDINSLHEPARLHFTVSFGMLDSESPTQALSVLMFGWPIWRLCSIDSFCDSEVPLSFTLWHIFSFLEVLVIECIEIDAR